jgi:alkaline phosphatase
MMSALKKINSFLPQILSVFIIAVGTVHYTAAGEPEREKKPLNIILLIGDGMGVAQVYSGYTANQGILNLLQFRSVGFSFTHSASDYITDSGAGGTAIATGHKTYNGAIGVNKDSYICKTILEYAEDMDLSTGLVSTSAITHATPASFIAHNRDRNDYEGIAADFLKTDIDVFIGGGRNHFSTRKDGRNLISELRSKNYQVIFSLDSIINISAGKLAGLSAPEHHPSVIEGRGEMLPSAVQTALNILDNNKKGFFLMVEGSQIDWGGHSNNTEYVAAEMVDFDRAIGVALEFAKKNPNTLVIVTADHETGGMAITGGELDKGNVTASFATTNHTAVMVPVFAYGPGAELFQGFQDNTDIFYKMMSLLGFEPVEPKDKP